MSGKMDQANCFVQIDLRFENLWYKPAVHAASRASAQRTVLHGVSSYALAGTVTGVMGPSGCGKTSLLHVIAGLVKPTEVEGVVTVNGRRKHVPKRLVGFVFQDDLMLSNLTVRETLMNVARLKLPASVSQEQRDSTVVMLMSELGILKCAESQVGGMRVRGISGGERKRLAVGMELVTSPSLLMLDEPTSGLDSSTALALVHTLKALAVKGHTVVCSIHQPRTLIWDLFDHLLVLEAGHVVFDGDLEKCVPFFERAGYILPPRTNAADWLMDLLTEDGKRADGPLLPKLFKEKSAEVLEDPEAILLERSEKGLADVQTDPEDGASQLNLLKRASTNTLASEELHVGGYATSFWVQFIVLLQRCAKQQSRTSLTFVNLLQTCTYTFMTSCFWWQLKESQSTMNDRASLLFFIVIAQSNAVVVGTVNVFVQERALLIREQAKGLYRVGAYMLAKTVSDMVNTVVMPTFVFANVVYWTVGLRATPEAFFTYITIFMLTLMVAQSMGLAISIMINDVGVALAIAPVVVLMLMILGGFYIPFRNIPIFVRWISHISFAKYAFTAFCINEFDGREYECDDVGQGQDSCPQQSCPVQGTDYLRDYRDMGGERLWVCLTVLFVMQVGFRSASYVFLRKMFRSA